MDAGLTDVLTTLRFQDGLAVYKQVDNPRWLKRQLVNIVGIQRTVSALEQQAILASGKSRDFSIGPQLKAAYTRLRAVHRKVRNQREDFNHQLSAKLVSQHEHILTEELSVASMQTDTTKGSAFKRSVSDAAWASFLDKHRSKAEEAGAKFEAVPTRQVKPTRRCSSCGFVKAREDMPLSLRMYACGFSLERDRNACRNTARFSFEGAWWGADNGPGTSPETPSEKARAPAQME